MRPIIMTRTTNHLPARRGIALLLVMAVVGLAAVLGYAMLSAAALQRQLQQSTTRAAEAEYLAESGISLAMYYLKNPIEAPGYLPGGEWYWPGTNGHEVGFAQGTSGTVNVKVTRHDTTGQTFTVSSTGRAGGSGAAIARSAHARLSVVTKPREQYAAIFDKDVILPSAALIGESTSDASRQGHVLSRRSIKILLGGLLYGNGYRGALVSSPAVPLLPGTWKPLPDPAPTVPLTLAELPDFSKYTRAGMGIQQATIKSDITIAAGTKLGPTDGNAGGVYIYEGNLTLKEGVEVQGTLIVKGNLIIKGANVRILPQAGLPALLVGGDIDMTSLLPVAEMRSEGLTWVGGRIFSTVAGTPRFEIRGNLIVAGLKPLFHETPVARVEIRDTWFASKAVAGITTTNTVKVVEWW